MLKNITQHARPLLAAGVIAVILIAIVYTRNNSYLNSLTTDTMNQAPYGSAKKSFDNLQQSISNVRNSAIPVATIKSDTNSIIDYLALGLPQIEAEAAQERIETSFTPYELEPVGSGKNIFE